MALWAMGLVVVSAVITAVICIAITAPVREEPTPEPDTDQVAQTGNSTLLPLYQLLLRDLGGRRETADYALERFETASEFSKHSARDKGVESLSSLISASPSAIDTRCILIEYYLHADPGNEVYGARLLAAHANDDPHLLPTFDINESQQLDPTLRWFWEELLEVTEVPLATWQAAEHVANHMIGTQLKDTWYDYGEHSITFYIVSIFDGIEWNSRLFESSDIVLWPDHYREQSKSHINRGAGGMGPAYRMLIDYVNQLDHFEDDWTHRSDEAFADILRNRRPGGTPE